ncbi:hypothetical protein DV515_00018158 [Chloebia gouldiae]|uniref:GRHL1/CP2 C-terminal domain-containing protein n=1 Tax=Chloebia gouldiae TaxID=44316 RepID=A0A3L8Q8B4_CHLGU|nr:hypothetical protein DV515_00018159 [Chloebia gouldiae]RLV63551.1 hypothetical protein DV515_00018158 [Chloebia gouldiae]
MPPQPSSPCATTQPEVGTPVRTRLLRLGGPGGTGPLFQHCCPAGHQSHLQQSRCCCSGHPGVEVPGRARCQAQLGPALGLQGPTWAAVRPCCPAVYHAVYLEELTAAELTEKLAQLFRVPAQQIQQIYKQGPTGIHVLVSDEMIQNFQDESCFVLDTMKAESNDSYHIILK